MNIVEHLNVPDPIVSPGSNGIKRHGPAFQALLSWWKESAPKSDHLSVMWVDLHG